METAIKNGDYVQAGGTLQQVSGTAERLQEAAMRLCTRRGAFVYAPAFGSRLAQVRVGAADANLQALQFAQEALAPILPQVRVTAVRVRTSGICVELQVQGTQQEVLVPYAESGGES